MKKFRRFCTCQKYLNTKKSKLRYLQKEQVLLASFFLLHNRIETSQPLNVKVVINETATHLTWMEPEFITGKLTNYQVLASLVNDTTEASTYITKDTHFDLAVLDGNGDLYYLWVSCLLILPLCLYGHMYVYVQLYKEYTRNISAHERSILECEWNVHKLQKIFDQKIHTWIFLTRKFPLLRYVCLCVHKDVYVSNSIWKLTGNYVHIWFSSVLSLTVCLHYSWSIHFDLVQSTTHSAEMVL